ncbi:hypothetical protein ACO1O0_004959 [Amphichorda felina]
MADTHSQEKSTHRPGDVPEADVKSKDTKGKKRSFFGLGKKKTDDSSKADTRTISKETSKLSSASHPAVSPSQPDPFHAPTSPTRALSISPRISSPAGSQIFERDVQDSASIQPNSPAIPSHIQTENHIPPVLDDASEAITNQKLDPDSVEIVTHNSHQPAAVTVTGTCSPPGSAFHDHTAPEWAAELSSFTSRESAIQPDSASNYGSLDSADVRRLSFISFADVVQAEHGGAYGNVTGSRDSIHMAGLTSLPPAGLNRSPSPIRSPVSSQGPGTSPPTSNPGSMKGVDMSPMRKPIGSPGSGSQNLAPLSQSGELNIETMSQALRRTTSADLSHVRSIPNSPIEGPGFR